MNCGTIGWFAVNCSPNKMPLCCLWNYFAHIKNRQSQSWQSQCLTAKLSLSFQCYDGRPNAAWTTTFSLFIRWKQIIIFLNIHFEFYLIVFIHTKEYPSTKTRLNLFIGYIESGFWKTYNFKVELSSEWNGY